MSHDDKPRPLNCDRDPLRWVREFRAVNGDTAKIDEGLLLAWFANAMMCGEDTYRWKLEERTRSSIGASANALEEFNRWWDDQLDGWTIAPRPEFKDWAWKSWCASMAYTESRRLPERIVFTPSAIVPVEETEDSAGDWQCKDFGDSWITFPTRKAAETYQASTGALMRYTRLYPAEA